LSHEKSDSKVLPKIEELTIQEENELEKNIVWIFGGRRSGTTWLGKQLLSHNTFYIHEPTLAEHLGVQLSPGSENSIRRIDASNETKNYFFSDVYKKTWSYYLKKLILHRIHAQVNDIKKKIIIKEPVTLLDVSDIISYSMPSSKIILLIRDGRDIIDSLIDARQKGGWLAKTTKAIIQKHDRPQFIKRRAKIWIKQTENLLKTFENSSKKQTILIKYEDLRHQTFETTMKIYKFLNIDISDKELEEKISKYSFEAIPKEEKGKGKFIRSASPGKWKENFSNDEIKIMNKIMGNTLKKLNYN